MILISLEIFYCPRYTAEHKYSPLCFSLAISTPLVQMSPNLDTMCVSHSRIIPASMENLNGREKILDSKTQKVVEHNDRHTFTLDCLIRVFFWIETWYYIILMLIHCETALCRNNLKNSMWHGVNQLFWRGSPHFFPYLQNSLFESVHVVVLFPIVQHITD